MMFVCLFDCFIERCSTEMHSKWCDVIRGRRAGPLVIGGAASDWPKADFCLGTSSFGGFIENGNAKYIV